MSTGRMVQGSWVLLLNTSKMLRYGAGVRAIWKAASVAPSSLDIASGTDVVHEVHHHVNAKTLGADHHSRSSQARTGWQHPARRRWLHSKAVA